MKNNEYVCVMVKLKINEKELLDKTLKKYKLSRRKFILQAIKGVSK